MFLSNRGSFRPETSGAYTLRRRGRGRPKSGSAIGACAVARLAGSGGPIGDYYGSANTGLTIPVAGTENGIDFGAFISAIINFLIVAWVVFMIVKAFNKMKDGTAKLPFLKNAKGEEVIEHAPTCPFCLEEINVGATRCPHCTAELPAPAEVTIEVVKK